MDELTQMNDSAGVCNPKLRHTSPSHETNQCNDLRRNLREPVDFGFQPLKDNFEELDSSHNIRFLRENLSAAVKPNNLFKQDRFVNRFVKQISAKFRRTQSVEILRVVSTCQSDLKSFQWGWIDSPQARDEFRSFNVLMGGWVIGKNSQPTTMNFLWEQTIITTTPIHIPRPDVAKAHFFQYPNCGYETLLNIAALPSEAKIIMQAVFPEGHMAVFGTIMLHKYG